jgi:putative methyltransferase (TIGR04325 family)
MHTRLNSHRARVCSERRAWHRVEENLHEIPYNFPLIATLMLAGMGNGNKLIVLDLGVCLGIHYFQSREFLRAFEVTWSVVELPEIPDAGNEHFASDELHLYGS